MAFKVKAVLLCASALLVQSALSCCGGGSSGSYSLGNSGCGCGCGSYGSSIGNYGSNIGIGSYGGSSINSAALSSGGDFLVTSVGPIVPTGIAVSSDVALGGDLTLCGTTPFLSAVAFEAELPTSGSGCVDYSCGSGCDVCITGVSGGGSLSSLGGCGCSCF